MKANLYIGKYFGTEIQIHWTFFLLIAWVILSEIRSGGSIESILFILQFLIAIMICALLHEIGHALAAKRFGIKTEKMLLLPIGGISTQDKSTESPMKELLITMAGPLVNVIIASFFTLPFL